MAKTTGLAMSKERAATLLRGRGFAILEKHLPDGVLDNFMEKMFTECGSKESFSRNMENMLERIVLKASLGARDFTGWLDEAKKTMTMASEGKIRALDVAECMSRYSDEHESWMSRCRSKIGVLAKATKDKNDEKAEEERSSIPQRIIVSLTLTGLAMLALTGTASLQLGGDIQQSMVDMSNKLGVGELATIALAGSGLLSISKKVISAVTTFASPLYTYVKTKFIFPETMATMTNMIDKASRKWSNMFHRGVPDLFSEAQIDGTLESCMLRCHARLKREMEESGMFAPSAWSKEERTKVNVELDRKRDRLIKNTAEDVAKTIKKCERDGLIDIYRMSVDEMCVMDSEYRDALVSEAVREGMLMDEVEKNKGKKLLREIISRVGDLSIKMEEASRIEGKICLESFRQKMRGAIEPPKSNVNLKTV